MPLQCDIRSPLHRGLVGHLGCTQRADETGDCKWEGADGRLVEWVNRFQPPTFLMPALTSLSGFPSHKIPVLEPLQRGESYKEFTENLPVTISPATFTF